MPHPVPATFGSTLDSPRILYALFFASGAAALVEEISWSRQLGLVFGQSDHTAAVVLGSYFAGMAIGYLLASSRAARIAPLRLYGVAEVSAGVWAALVPTVIDLVERFAPAALVDHPSVGVRTVARAGIGFLTLLPATVALGATLPLMAQALAGERRSGPNRVAVAYAMNTLGALAGVIGATAFGLVIVGVRGSNYVAAGVSVACGLVAIKIGDARHRAGAGEATGDAAGGPVGSLAFPLAIAAVSGFGLLSLEVLYTRMFALVLHNSTYSFGIVVALFLLGLAIGSAAMSRVRMDPHRLAGWASLFGAAAVAASLPLFASMTGMAYLTSGGNFATYVAGMVAIVAAVVLPPVALLGMVLPAMWSAADAAGESKGRAVGRLTAANTLAAAVGSLAASFILVPRLGLWSAFAAVALLFAAAAVVLLWRSGAILAPLVTGPILAVGIVLAARGLNETPSVPPGSTILRTWDGPYGLLDVVRENATGELTIRQNLHYGLGSTRATGRELSQGHLPLLLHSKPKDVLFLGLGTGVTAASSLSHPEVERVVAVELNPDVVEAARLYFSKSNRGVLDDPRVTVKVDDARHFLARTDRKFDVVVSDLFVPWESRTGYLYTVEHYREVRSKLKPGGLFCQWLALYQVGEREFESIAESIASVFPTTTLWWGQVDPHLSFVALIGSEGPLEFDDDVIGGRLERLRRKPEESDEYLLKSAEKLLIHFNGEWAGGGDPRRLNTDEHPRVEFLAPITQRGKYLLTGSVLREYQAKTLAKLPRTGLRRPRPLG